MARKSRKNLPQPEQAAASVLLPELEEAKMPAAIYGRLSVEDEETEESMETQIALVQDYINRSREAKPWHFPLERKIRWIRFD